ncbi:MAG: UDP-N-acetylglucosamine 4,6-dehydratase family protein [Pseudomonadota bacterium]
MALYRLEQSLTALKQELQDKARPETEFILADVRDAEKIERLFKKHKPEIVFHAAAYKHVPIIEDNVNAGVANNILGTYAVAKAAATCKTERFVLVSTDKAVRPTNIMGATKRMAELVIQAFAQKRGQTAFSMVRFGNVLGSSGSVIPLFRNQIATGGPVTVTHPEITRFFMTINEAAQLVIQAGSMAKGGEVFLLDMGEPVKILKLARLMIQLSGKTTRDASRPNGDVEIVYTGLRPGEKLYEELLVNDDALATQHPKIMMASEKAINGATLEKVIVRLKKSVETDDVSGSLKVLSEFVEGFDREKS